MTETATDTEERPSFETDAYERRWIIVAFIILIAFGATVAIAGFALGFQVPGDESRVDPRTVAETAPWNEPGLRDLGNGQYEVYMLARQYLFEPRDITIPVGSTVTFFITSTDVQHGFKLQDTNVNLQIVPGQVSRLTVQFEEPGLFPFICHEFCGIGHAAMFGGVTVDPEAQGE